MSVSRRHFLQAVAGTGLVATGARRAEAQKETRPTLEQLDRAAARQYVQSVEREAGGFHGGLWDEGTDVEYTFYGLGVLALVL